MHSMPHSSAINAVSAKERRLALKNLILYRQKVSRFVKNILNYEQDTKLRNTEGDAQALAKQAAKAKIGLALKIGDCIYYACTTILRCKN